MELTAFLQVFWFLVIGTAFFIFCLLDGFDLGVGMTLPFISKKTEHKRVLLNSVWPVWDGNELWGLIGAGGLFATFPAVFANLLSLLYPAVVLLMAILLFRPISFELWFHDEKGRRLWEAVFLVTSFVIAFVFGAVFGITVSGMPLSAPEDQRYLGALLALFHPLPLISGLLMVGAFLVHGNVYLIKKTEGEIKERAQKILARVWIAFLVLWVLFAMVLLTTRSAWDNPLVWAALAITLIASLLVRLSVKTGETRLFLFSGLSLGGIIATFGAAQFPVILRDSLNPAQSLTIFANSSPDYSLGFLAVLGTIVLAVVAVYTVVVYRIFKGKVKPDSIQY